MNIQEPYTSSNWNAMRELLTSYPCGTGTTKGIDVFQRLDEVLDLQKCNMEENILLQISDCLQAGAILIVDNKNKILAMSDVKPND